MDQNRKTRLLAKLRAEIDSLPPRLKMAAKYIVDNPGDFGMDPIRVSADQIGVSANSLVRLAERMGYSGFEAFRDPFRAALVTDSEERLGEDWLENLQQGAELSRTQANLAQNEMNIVARSLRMMSEDKIVAVLERLLAAHQVYVVATRASYALAYYFHYVGRMALPTLQLIPRHMGAAVDELVHVGERDVLIAITFAPYSADTIQAMRFAKDRGAQIILISDSEVIAPRVEPDITFAVATQSQHSFECYGGAMAVLDCLIGHLVNAGGSKADQRIKSYEALREDTGAYWTPSRMPKLRR